MLMSSLFQVMRSILEVLMYMIRNDDGEDAQYGLNLCIRVNFTGANRSCKLLGVGSLNPTEKKDDRLMAHITIASLTRPGLNTEWNEIAKRMTGYMLGCVPRSTVHWKTEWHTLLVSLHALN